MVKIEVSRHDERTLNLDEKSGLVRTGPVSIENVIRIDTKSGAIALMEASKPVAVLTGTAVNSGS